MLEIGTQTQNVVYDDCPAEGFERLKAAGFDCVDFSLNTYLINTQIYKLVINDFFRQSVAELQAYFRPHKEAAATAGIRIHQLHMPYPVYVPQGIKAYKITSVNRTSQLVSKTAISVGSTLPAGASILVKGTPGQTVAFRPSTKSPVSFATTCLKGDRVSQVLTTSDVNTHFYQLLPSDEDPQVLAFKRVELGILQPAATPWLQVTSALEPLDCFYLDAGFMPTGIQSIPGDVPPSLQTSPQGHPAPLFDITGRKLPVSTNLPKGIYIQNGKKIIH